MADASTARGVFVSYASEDRDIAFRLCAVLERDGLPCWIAPRDIVPGSNYAEAIIEAIDRSRLMILVFTTDSNNSPQVRREVERAVSKDLTILPFRIHETPPSKSLEYFISSSHWLDATGGEMERHLAFLAQVVRSLLTPGEKGFDAATQTPLPELDSRAPAATLGARVAPTPGDWWSELRTRGAASIVVAQGDLATLDRLSRALAGALVERGYTTDDGRRAAVVVHELATNARHAGGGCERFTITVSDAGDRFEVAVSDNGPGFPIAERVAELAARLDAGEREHGLLRVLRYGGELFQSLYPHTVHWRRWRRPESLPSLFDGHPGVAPVLFSWTHHFIRICSETYDRSEFGQSLWPQSPRFMELVFDPLRRAQGGWVGFEVSGGHPTVIGGIDPIGLWYLFETFRASTLLHKNVVLYLDTEPEEHAVFRRVLAQNPSALQGIAQGQCGALQSDQRRTEYRLFEDANACSSFLSALERCL